MGRTLSPSRTRTESTSDCSNFPNDLRVSSTSVIRSSIGLTFAEGVADLEGPPGGGLVMRTESNSVESLEIKLGTMKSLTMSDLAGLPFNRGRRFPDTFRRLRDLQLDWSAKDIGRGLARPVAMTFGPTLRGVRIL